MTGRRLFGRRTQWGKLAAQLNAAGPGGPAILAICRMHKHWPAFEAADTELAKLGIEYRRACASEARAYHWEDVTFLGLGMFHGDKPLPPSAAAWSRYVNRCAQVIRAQAAREARP